MTASLENIANIVEILGVVAILTAVVSALVQLRLHRRDQRNLAILELARSFEDREFTDAYLKLSALEDNISGNRLAALGPDYESAALCVGMKYETVGLLIYKGVVPVDALEDLVGDAALTLWRKLNRWVFELREKRRHPRALEWFEWLVVQLEARPNVGRAPAARAYPVKA